MCSPSYANRIKRTSISSTPLDSNSSILSLTPAIRGHQPGKQPPASLASRLVKEAVSLALDQLKARAPQMFSSVYQTKVRRLHSLSAVLFDEFLPLEGHSKHGVKRSESIFENVKLRRPSSYPSEGSQSRTLRDHRNVQFDCLLECILDAYFVIFDWSSCPMSDPFVHPRLGPVHRVNGHRVSKHKFPIGVLQNPGAEHLRRPGSQLRANSQTPADRDSRSPG